VDEVVDLQRCRQKKKIDSSVPPSAGTATCGTDQGLDQKRAFGYCFLSIPFQTIPAGWRVSLPVSGPVNRLEVR